MTVTDSQVSLVKRQVTLKSLPVSSVTFSPTVSTFFGSAVVVVVVVVVVGVVVVVL